MSVNVTALDIGQNMIELENWRRDEKRVLAEYSNCFALLPQNRPKTTLRCWLFPFTRLVSISELYCNSILLCRVSHFACNRMRIWTVGARALV